MGARDIWIYREPLSAAGGGDAALGGGWKRARRVESAGRCRLVRQLALLYGLVWKDSLYPAEVSGNSGTPVESFFGTLTIAEGRHLGLAYRVSVTVVAIFL